jgi:hypothetical protein
VVIAAGTAKLLVRGAGAKEVAIRQLPITADTPSRQRLVRIEPIRADWAGALAEGDDVFASRFGVVVEPDWAGFPEAVPLLVEAAGTATPREWKPSLFFDDDGALVGNVGWKGPPQDGVAELGYAVARLANDAG